MAGIQLSTAGVTLWYAAEATAGTRPTTGYEKISEIKSIPELNPEPDNLETTTLEETERYILPGSPLRWVCRPWRSPLFWRRLFISPRPELPSGQPSLLIWKA